MPAAKKATKPAKTTKAPKAAKTTKSPKSAKVGKSKPADAKYPAWWNSMNAEDQQDYLDKHPSSRFKVIKDRKNAKKDAGPKASGGGGPAQEEDTKPKKGRGKKAEVEEVKDEEDNDGEDSDSDTEEDDSDEEETESDDGDTEDEASDPEEEPAEDDGEPEDLDKLDETEDKSSGGGSTEETHPLATPAVVEAMSKVPEETKAYVEANPKKVATEIIDAIDTVESTIEDRIKTMPSKDKVELGKAIKENLDATENAETDDEKAVARVEAVMLGAKVLVKLGIATIGIALGVSLGLPPIVSTAFLLGDRQRFSQQLRDYPLDQMLVSYGKDIFDGVRNRVKRAVKKPSDLVQALTTEKPDFLKQQPRETASVSTNLSEVIKEFTSIENTDYAIFLYKIQRIKLDWSKQTALVDFMYKLELVRQKLTNMIMRFKNAPEYKNYIRRVSVKLGKVNALLAKVHAEITKSTKLAVPKELQRFMSSIKSQLDYEAEDSCNFCIRSDDALQPCIRLTLSGVKLRNTLYPELTLYFAMDGKNFKFAYTRSPSTPMTFDTVDTTIRPSLLLKRYSIV